MLFTSYVDKLFIFLFSYLSFTNLLRNTREYFLIRTLFEYKIPYHNAEPVADRKWTWSFSRGNFNMYQTNRNGSKFWGVLSTKIT